MTRAGASGNEPPARSARRAARVRGMPETVFSRYAKLALASGAVNLGQGFPDDPPAGPVLEALRAAAEAPQQYAPRQGVARLREQIARLSGARRGRPLDPERDVSVTVGATEALFSALQGLCEEGDEVVLLTPCYDAYPFMVRLAGATPTLVPMEVVGERWRLDPERLRAALTPRTRAIVINDPHNPTGAVLEGSVLQRVADLAREFDLTLIVDEVYEQVAFTPVESLARLAPERTLSIGSAGKTFGVTGWKIGWATGPAELVAALVDLRQWVSYAVATPLQHAVAALLAEVAPDGGAGGAVASMLREQRSGLAARRDRLLAALREAGARVTLPDGGYFIHADVAAWGEGDDVALCDALPERAGVVAIPGSAFHHQAEPGEVWVRFAYCRSEASVAEGARRLAAFGAAHQHPPDQAR